MAELHSRRPMHHTDIVEPELPDTGVPSIADAAIAMFRAMHAKGLTEARAKCPFCEGYLHAGRFGNARRAKVECDTCGRQITESFRSAMRPTMEAE
jgi:hypothetical protein